MTNSITVLKALLASISDGDLTTITDDDTTITKAKHLPALVIDGDEVDHDRYDMGSVPESAVFALYLYDLIDNHADRLTAKEWLETKARTLIDGFDLDGYAIFMNDNKIEHGDVTIDAKKCVAVRAFLLVEG